MNMAKRSISLAKLWPSIQVRLQFFRRGTFQKLYRLAQLVGCGGLSSATVAVQVRVEALFVKINANRVGLIARPAQNVNVNFSGPSISRRDKLGSLVRWAQDVHGAIVMLHRHPFQVLEGS